MTRSLVFVKLETIPLYYILEIQSFQQLSFNFKPLKNITQTPFPAVCFSKQTDIAQLENWFSARSQLILFVKKKEREKKRYFQILAPVTEHDKLWHLFSWLPLTAFPVSMEMDIRTTETVRFWWLIAIADFWVLFVFGVVILVTLSAPLYVIVSYTSETASRVESYIVCPRCHKLACLTVIPCIILWEITNLSWRAPDFRGEDLSILPDLLLSHCLTLVSFAIFIQWPTCFCLSPGLFTRDLDKNCPLSVCFSRKHTNKVITNLSEINQTMFLVI